MTARRGKVIPMTTGDTASDWATWARRQGMAATTVSDRTRIIRLAERTLGARLADADPGAVADWIAGKRTPETRRAYSAALRSVVAAGLAPPTVTELLPRVRVPRHLPHPTPDVVVATLLDLPDPGDVAAVILAAYAGLRVSEVARCQPDDLERVAGGMRVRVVGKGGVERMAPIPQWAADELRGRLPIGRSAHTIGYRIGAAIKAAGGRGGIHGLRHAYATELLRRSDLRIVQESLGHASPTTTAIYTLIDDDAATAAVEQMPRPRLRPVA